MKTSEIIIQELNLLTPVIKALNLPSIEYVINTQSNGFHLAECHAEIVKTFMTISDVRFINKIVFFPEVMEKMASSIFPAAMKTIALREIVRHCILHEHRHGWQYTYEKSMAIRHHSVNEHSFRGHGESLMESGANEFALSQSVDKDEMKIFEYLNITQCLAGNVYPRREDVLRLRKLYSQFQRKYSLKSRLVVVGVVAVVGLVLYALVH